MCVHGYNAYELIANVGKTCNLNILIIIKTCPTVLRILDRENQR